MEKRNEIKDAVKSKIIELMALDLIKEQGYQTLRDELSAELFASEEKKKERELNFNDGYDPINEEEEKYKKAFGFIFNPIPVKERFSAFKKEETERSKERETTCYEGFPNKPSYREFSNNYERPSVKFSDRFQERFGNEMPFMRDRIADVPSTKISDLPEVLQNSLRNFSSKSRNELSSAFTIQGKETAETISKLSPEVATSFVEDIKIPKDIVKTTRKKLADKFAKNLPKKQVRKKQHLRKKRRNKKKGRN